MAVHKARLEFDDQKEITTVEVGGEIFIIDKNGNASTGDHSKIKTKNIDIDHADVARNIDRPHNAEKGIFMFTFSSPGCFYKWNGRKWVYV